LAVLCGLYETKCRYQERQHAILLGKVSLRETSLPVSDRSCHVALLNCRCVLLAIALSVSYLRRYVCCGSCCG
jgi:hypothetical protein